ncbi:MAG TPA: alginate lyase family protein [Bryobacteraceae bacterium]
MRSPREIAFRLAQESGNLAMRLRAPRATGVEPAPLSGLAAPRETAEALHGTAYAAEVLRIADELLAHRFPLLGLNIETGPEIEWRRDPASGIATPPRYFRRIPYLDAARAGDHKLIWELNRHQHWVLLAQAFLLSGRRGFLDEIRDEWESWNLQNPFLRGINWTSALEVAFRALSWVWVYHLVGGEMGAEFRGRLLESLYRHGRYLERNLSYYFSPNTHLLGEAVALHALAVLFPSFPEARRWRETGARVVDAQMAAQVRADGSHFEQSAYYHVYALDMFLFHAVLAGAGAEYASKLKRMAGYLSALLGPAGRLPLLGDDDGGRFFHPFGERARFGRGTLATAAALLGGCEWGSAAEDAHEVAAWWLGPQAIAASKPARSESGLYDGAGVAVLSAGQAHVVVDAGPFGPGSAGHSHSDTLSLVARRGAEDLLIDPGTYTYVGDPAWRDRFRGSAAHNTLRVDGRDQATAAGPFRWTSPSRVQILHWRTAPDSDYLEAVVRYGGFEHSRRVLFLKPDLLLVTDEVAGEGNHLVEQFWHAGAAVRALGESKFALGHNAVLALDAEDGMALSDGGEYGWRSDVLGVKKPAPVIRVGRTAALPVRFAALLDFEAGTRRHRISLAAADAGSIELRFEAGGAGTVRFRRGAAPEYTRER